MRNNLKLWWKEFNGGLKFTMDTDPLTADLVLESYEEDRVAILHNGFGPITPVQRLHHSTGTEQVFLGAPFLNETETQNTFKLGSLPGSLKGPNVIRCSPCKGIGLVAPTWKYCPSCNGKGMILGQTLPIVAPSDLEQYLQSLR